MAEKHRLTIGLKKVNLTIEKLENKLADPRLMILNKKEFESEAEELQYWIIEKNRITKELKNESNG
jgi:hypothetical protein